MKQLLSIIAHNRPGVLSKITGLISRRGYNIDSLMSGTTEKPGYARLTITVDADDRTVDQISRQVEKISEVEKITVLKKKQAPFAACSSSRCTPGISAWKSCSSPLLSAPMPSTSPVTA